MTERFAHWVDKHPLQARVAGLVFVLGCMAFALFT